MSVPEREPGRLEQRRERFLQEAESLFLQHGYDGASVNEIVRRAGGSLATLYSEFGSKEQLFAEIVRRRSSAPFEGMPAECPHARSTRSSLVQLGTRLLERVLSPESLGFYRIAISEGPRFPHLRKVFLEGSYPTFIGRLGEMLVTLGVATPQASFEVAEEFLSLVHGQLVFRAACGDSPITTKEQTRHVERAVDAFLTIHPAKARK